MKNNLLFILDDDPFYTQLLSTHLSKYNFSIEAYSSSVVCKENLYKNPFILLLDFNLNENDVPVTGKDIFMEIRNTHPEIKIIIISNQESGEVVMDLIQTGVRDYVEKDSNVFYNLDLIIEGQLGSGNEIEDQTHK